jgi:hypothetical protein
LVAREFKQKVLIFCENSRMGKQPNFWYVTSGAWQRAVVEKKFSVRPVLSATVGKAFVDGLLAFAESFRLSAKPGFPVVVYGFPVVVLYHFW